MRFKNPGGELSWLTPLLVLGGGYLAYHFYREGSTAMAVMSASLGLLCLLVWFDIKWVAIPLIGWFSLVLVAAVTFLIFKEFSWRKLIHVGAMGYTIYALWEWYRRREREDVDPEMEELQRLTSSHRRQISDDRQVDPDLP
jgi:hypothetical protein